MSLPLSFSFELFPPRTPEGVAKLPAVIVQLAALGPHFFSVTYGAGGSTRLDWIEVYGSPVKRTGSTN